VEKSQTVMKEILVLLGVFALGYVLTMGLVFALLKLFFPFQPADKVGVDNSVTVVKVNRNASRATSRLRKVRLANG
jgi:hypothetical protein